MRRSHLYLSTLILWIAAAAWLVFAADSQSESPRLFGYWRTRDMLLAGGSVWLGLATALAAGSRRRLLQFLFASILTVVSWLLLELVLLLNLADLTGVFHLQPDPFGSDPIANVDCRGVTHEDLAARYGRATRDVPFHFKSDRHGFRNHQDRDRASVYLLGDSILVAGLLKFEDTIAARLEAGLGKSVMNVALIGIGPERELELLQRLDPDLSDKQLVLHFIFEGNDLGDSSSAGEASEASAVAEAKAVSGLDRTFAKSFTIWLHRKTDPRIPFGRIGDRDYLFMWLRNSFAGLEHAIPGFKLACKAVHDEVVRRGGIHGLVFVPTKIRVLGPSCSWPKQSTIKDYRQELNPMRDWLRDWCKASGVPILDVTEPLQAAVESGRVPWFACDTHPNETGHEVITAAIREWSLVRAWHEAKDGR